MKQVTYLMVFCAFAFSACTGAFKKVKDSGGLEYKIIKGSGAKATYGNFLELSVTTKYGDSVLNGAGEGPTVVLPLDTTKLSPVNYSIFKDIRKGDSLIIRQSTDSIIKNGGGNVPPFIKKGKYIFSCIKVVNLFTTQAQADSCQMAQMTLMQKKDSLQAIEQIKKDDKLIDEYLAKNKINTVKAEKGTYVEIINPGTGNVADTGQVMMINYTGKSFDGAAFDSNTDSAFQHVEPLPVEMWAPRVIPGWVDGLKMLKKGAKAKFYVPSALAYGKRGSGEKIKPNENLIFDVEVTDILSKAQYAVIEKAMQEKQMAQQKMMQQMQQQMQQQGGGGK